MTLSDKQWVFLQNLSLLIQYARARGYKLTGGELWRSRAAAAANARSGLGIENSLHMLRLAQDFNLFKGSKFLEKSEDHRELGEFWKKLHPLNRWGGDFSKPDGNHYSMAHGGRA